ncbi:NAD(P)-dependent oxidoreductase [Gryllotalpicola ginsengisoli]|uniref:NAD(P)-dependent oxidoreductase n=1 Tax=Gryllotalpicola ginsengisoli TaxID=444608 RepID=UPI0003B34DBB|nr:NAD(P)H-binding protein [Gryllotalpicola ginsengisoli]
MTSIAIIGGTGYTGSNIAAEAVKRGHSVTAVSRHAPEHPLEGVTYVQGEISDQGFIEKLAADHDELVVAIHAVDADNQPVLPPLVPMLADAAIKGGARLSFVGGAGSTLVAPAGPRLVDTDFPEEYKPEAIAHAGILDWLRSDEKPEGLQWFYLSPAAEYGAWNPGTALGSYRTSADVMLTDDEGRSQISGADYALAYVDEIEQRKHINQRFVVGY